MNFTCTVIIDLPIEKVFELFNNTDYLKEWQDDFVSHQHLSGTPGEPGSKSKIIYQTRKHRIELVETILTKTPPYEVSGLYEHKHMVNTMINRFSSVEGDKTKYESEVGYSKFIGFMPKLMGLLMPTMFKKQAQKWANQFKAFAERNK